MNRSRIQYSSRDEFYDGVYKLTTMGLLFEAHERDLVIILTGGY